MFACAIINERFSPSISPTAPTRVSVVQAVTSFSLPPDALAAHVAALDQLTARGGGNADWCKRVLKSCEDALSGYLRHLSHGAMDDDRLSIDTTAIAGLFTVGEVGEASPPARPSARFMCGNACSRHPTRFVAVQTQP